MKRQEEEVRWDSTPGRKCPICSFFIHKVCIEAPLPRGCEHPGMYPHGLLNGALDIAGIAEGVTGA